VGTCTPARSPDFASYEWEQSPGHRLQGRDRLVERANHITRGNPNSVSAFSIFATFPAQYLGNRVGPFVDQVVGTAFLVALCAFAYDLGIRDTLRARGEVAPPDVEPRGRRCRSKTEAASRCSASSSAPARTGVSTTDHVT
jgi:hypothetical protein